MTKAPAKKWDILNTKFILREKRFLWLDYDKGISIILVAYGHSYFMLSDHGYNMSLHPHIQYICYFLYGFRMPLFFIVSGTLISRSLDKHGLSAYLINRVNNILYPLLIWGGIQISLNYFSPHSTVNLHSYLDLLLNPRNTGIFWYLNALFFIGAIYSILKYKLKTSPYLQLGIGMVLYVIAGYIHINNIEVGMVTDVCQFYFFFALGDAISQFFFNEAYVKRFTSWKIFCSLLVIFVYIQYRFTQINMVDTPDGINYVENKLPWFYMIEALVGCATSISFSFLLQKYKIFSFFRVVGYHSLFIYCMQIIIMSTLRVIFINILKIHNIPALFFLIWSLGVFIPILIYNICLKINVWWLFTFKKPHEHYDFVQQAELQ